MLSQYPCPTANPACILPPPTGPTMCPPSIGCPPGGAHAQTGLTALPGTCGIPPVTIGCIHPTTTVAGGAQAQFSFPTTHCFNTVGKVVTDIGHATAHAATAVTHAVTGAIHSPIGQTVINTVAQTITVPTTVATTVTHIPQPQAQVPTLTVTTTVQPTRVPQLCPVNTLYTANPVICRPSHLLGCTGYQGCPVPTTTAHTGPQVVTATPTAQPTVLIGCTGYQGCIQPTTTVQGGAQAQFSFPTTHCFDTVVNATKAATHAITGTIHNTVAATTVATTVMPTTTAVTVATTAQAQVPTMTTTVQPTHLIGCTGYRGCNIPTHTLATVCTLAGCLPTRGIGCPDTISCPPATTAQAQFSFPTTHCFDPIKHTINATVHATQAATNAITDTVHNTVTNAITRTAIHETTVATTIVATTAQAEVPTMTTTVQPTHLIGCTGYQGCNVPTHTLATVCTQIGCLPTRGIGCPDTISCPPVTTAQAQVPNMTTTVQPTHLIGCTGYLGCNRPTGVGSPATVCTLTPACRIPTHLGCPNTIACPPHVGGAQAQFSFPTLHCTLPIVCAVTAIARC